MINKNDMKSSKKIQIRPISYICESTIDFSNSYFSYSAYDWHKLLIGLRTSRHGGYFIKSILLNDLKFAIFKRKILNE